jgi:hypothetical protein
MRRREYLATVGVWALAGCGEARNTPGGDPNSAGPGPTAAGTDAESVRNVRDYGAVGNGESDDRPAIQAAIDDAGDGDTVYLPTPEAYYNVSRRPSKRDTIVIDGDAHADRLTLEGTGPDTVVKMEDAPGGNYALVRLLSPADYTVRIRDLVLDGNKANVGDAWPSFCLLARDNGAAATGDVRIENVELRNSVGHGADIQFGGVTMTRCTARGNRRHGFGFNTGYSGLHSPRPVLEHSLATKNATGDGGYYNLDMSTGELYMHDCVLVGGVNGFKISDDARTLVAERIRARDGSNAAFRSTGPDETTSVEFGDVVVSGYGSYFRLNGPETYELQDGTSLIVTDCAADKEAQLYLTDSATLDASNAAVYSNRANSAAGFESDTGANGSVISEYYVYDNDDGPTGSLANVTIDQMEERDVTDIDGVPTADEVGAWSRSWRVPVPLW